MPRLLLLLSVVALSSLTPLRAQGFKISEVIPAPILGDPIVEITNVGLATLDTSDARILIGGASHARLPATSLAPGAYLRIHIGVSGTNTSTDLFMPGVGPLLLQAHSVALYQGEIVGDLGLFFENPDNILDFMQWGAHQGLIAGVAQGAGVWLFANTYIPAPFPTESLAWSGVGNQPGDWFRDTSPTLGGPNVQASASVTDFGFGCTPAALGPTLGVSSPPALRSCLSRSPRTRCW